MGKRIKEEIRSLIVIVLIVLAVRAFVIEPYKIPTPSMVPNLLAGDHIFVEKFAYTIGIPFTKIKLIEFRSPKRGDVIVFLYPENESINFVKRVIGIPGDTIAIRDRVVYVNGQPLVIAPASTETLMEQVDEKHRNPFQHVHLESFPKTAGFDESNTNFEPHPIIWDDLHRNPINQYFDEFTVPEGQYFVMGDNRDRSLDSRTWGAVPKENIKGKGILIWLSYHGEKSWFHLTEKFRWRRFFTVIQ